MREQREFTKKSGNWMEREARLAYFLLAPAIILIGGLILAPVTGTLFRSFYRDVTFLPPVKFIGLLNYKHLLTDVNFLQSIRFTVLFTLVAVFLETVIGLFFALVINEEFKLRGLMRAIVLIPWAIPTIISAKTWFLLYNYNYGLFNFLITKLHLSAKPINWLGTSYSAFFSIVMADVWKTAPFMAILFLAGLQSISKELYEAAEVDGASLTSQFTRITLPLLRPVLTIALIFRTIDSLRIFDLIYVLTGGGPGGATSSVSMYGFKLYILGDFGYGSTVSVVTFILVLLFTLIYLKVGRFGESF
jgi:multiple sugar transport system permease protein